MISLRYVGPHEAVYRARAHGVWAIGEVREVGEAEADRLLRKGWFEIVDPEPAPPVAPRKRSR